MRTELAVRHAYPGMSRREAIVLCERGAVRDGRGAKLKKGQQVPEGSTLQIDLSKLDERSEEERAVLRSKQQDLVWLAEGDAWAAIRKPAGLGSLKRHFGDDLHFGEYARQLILAKTGRDTAALPDQGVVHRLDHGTSGVMLVALDAQTLDTFVAARGVTLKRTYWAMTRNLRLDEGVVDTPLDDQPATTWYKVLARSGNVALFQADIQGGRRHQIRKHMAQLGCPLLGDGKYGETPAPRLALHAWRLMFAEKEKTQRIYADPGGHFWNFAPDLVRPTHPETE